MDIIKELPFEFCDSCSEFILDVNEKTLYYTDFSGTSSHIAITVRCKNEGKCKQLKHNLHKLENTDAAET